MALVFISQPKKPSLRECGLPDLAAESHLRFENRLLLTPRASLAGFPITELLTTLYKFRRAQSRVQTPPTNLEFNLVVAQGLRAFKLIDPLWKTRVKARSKKVQKIGTVSAMGFGKDARFNQLQWTAWPGLRELTR